MKLICISNDLSDIRTVKEFAKNNECQLQFYSVEGWERQQSHSHIDNDSNQNVYLSQSKFKNNIFQSMDEIKIRAIQDALLLSRGNASKAAKMLKIGRATLYRISKQFGIDMVSMRYGGEQKPDMTVKQIKKSA